MNSWIGHFLKEEWFSKFLVGRDPISLQKQTVVIKYALFSFSFFRQSVS